MTDHRIELMRANADFLEERGCSAAAFVLRREAEQIEREQADEKRIEYLAQKSWNARFADMQVWAPLTVQGLDWHSIDERFRETERIGIRAVLHAINIETMEVPF